MLTRLDQTTTTETATVAIAESVLGLLGEPDGFHRVQVKPVFGDRYRVNVYVRSDFATYKVAHSYLVSADSEGRVIESSPAITRLY